jgi:ABC-type maltose transport system permease subunit
MANSLMLAGYLSIIVQIANLGPLAYSVTRYAFPERVNQNQVVYILLLIGELTDHRSKFSSTVVHHTW